MALLQKIVSSALLAKNEKEVELSQHGEELLPGTKLLHGQYEIERFLNSGGFGITYVARDSLDRQVVIKECYANMLCQRRKATVFPRSRGSEKDLGKIIQYFTHEARNLAKLTHPHIVGVHNVFEDNNTAYMAMDLIEGVDLLEVIENPALSMQPDEIVAIARQLLDAVAYTHENNLLHCDISPDNILIDKMGQPTLIDFGAARVIAATARQRQTGIRAVKDCYSPQEFFFEGGNRGPWSDIYGLGATLYHLVSGEPPVDCQYRVAHVSEGKPDPYAPLEGAFKGFPAGFLAAIDRALRLSAENRFASAGEWLKALNDPAGTQKGNIEVFNSKSRVRNPRKSSKPKSIKLEGAKCDQRRAASSKPEKGKVMATTNITKLNEINGFIGACLVDSETGMMMEAEGGGDKFDLEAASAANTDVVRAKLRAMDALGLKDRIDDILITLGTQFHLIRPLADTPTAFLYVALDKKDANLGMARVQVKKLEETISL